MSDFIGKTKAVVIAVVAALSSWLGILALPFGLLVLANILDYGTGLAAAPYRGQQRNSYKGIKGIAKKVCMWLLVGVGVIIDTLLTYCTNALGWHVPINFLVGSIVAVWLLTNELISILENISDIGVDIPPFLVPIVKWVKAQAESKAKEALPAGTENSSEVQNSMENTKTE